MKLAPRQETAVYPPPQISYPQFIAAFGQGDGARAAWRIFLSERDDRLIPAEAVGLEALAEIWSDLLGRCWPLSLGEELRPSFVDLDPQVSGVTRQGEDVQLILALLMCALEAARAIERAEREDPFTGRVASIWAVGQLDARGQLGFSPEPLRARFERFLEYCQVDASDRRHLFVCPIEGRDVVGDRLEQARLEMSVAEHLAHGQDELRRLFFEANEPARVHVLYVYPESREVARLLDAFSAIWEMAHQPDPGTRHSGELPKGMTLGERYEIVRRLGSGGFAIVYEATDRKVDRQVALKVIDLERTSDEAHRPAYIRRFQREAKLAASVRHPCVVEVHDVGVLEDGETPYMVMELLEGWDLEVHMREHGAISPRRLLPLFVQALEGLGCAHEVGIVHKDLKPSNLFLKHPDKRHEQLCIVDFGVARQAGADTARLTHTDGAFGTPHYMAPEYSTEQLTSPALDVYQMGLILVELLMGAPVVTHPDPVAAMFQHVRGDLSIPTSLLESSLGEVIRRSLSLDPKARFEDGFAFADALREIDPARIPVVSGDDERVSLAPSDELERPQTPHSGQRLIPSRRPPPHTPTGPPRRLSAEASEGSDEVALATTLDLEDMRSELPSPASPQLHPSSARTSSPSAPPSEQNEPDEGELDEPIVQYSSPAPYLAVTAALLVALAVVIGLLVTQEDPPPAPKTEMVTEYDRELARLRERVEGLPDLLEQGRIDEVLIQIERMDDSEVRLTPDEVAHVRDLRERARAEEKNRALLDRALDLVNRRQHQRALELVRQLPKDSVFQSHDDRRRLLDRSKVALLPRIQQLRIDGDYGRALKLLNLLVAVAPDNMELRALQSDVAHEQRAQRLAREADMGSEDPDQVSSKP